MTKKPLLIVLCLVCFLLSTTLVIAAKPVDFDAGSWEKVTKTFPKFCGGSINCGECKCADEPYSQSAEFSLDAFDVIYDFWYECDFERNCPGSSLSGTCFASFSADGTLLTKSDTLTVTCNRCFYGTFCTTAVEGTCTVWFYKKSYGSCENYCKSIRGDDASGKMEGEECICSDAEGGEEEKESDKDKETSPEAECSGTSLDACETKEDCVAVGGYWYTKACHVKPAGEFDIKFKYTDEEINKKLDEDELIKWFNEKMKDIKTRTGWWWNPIFWWQHTHEVLDHGFGNDPDFVDKYGYGRCGDSMMWLQREMDEELGLPSQEATLSITGEKWKVFTHTAVMVRPQGLSNEDWKNVVTKFNDLATSGKDPSKEDLDSIRYLTVLDPYFKKVTNVGEFVKGWNHVIIQ